MRSWGRSPSHAQTGGAGKRPARSLKARAIAHLARRDYARAELRQKLLGAGGQGPSAGVPNSAPDAGEVDALLDELAALGYLSDERYARAVVTRKAGSHSRRAIAGELKAKGVASETVAEAMNAAEGDDTSAMIALWQRRFGKVPANEREKARQVRFLQSRGFALSAIFRLLRDPPVDTIDTSKDIEPESP